MTDYISLIIAALSAGFAGFCLILNYQSIRENNTTRQIQLLNNMFKDIQENAKILFKDYKNADLENRKKWDSLLFNSIELFAFLVNEKFIKDKKISGFFDDAIVMWYEEIFLKHYSKEDIGSSKIFPEFKKLYHTIKLKE